MELLARHVSPDGALTLLVERAAEPDGTALISLGFERSGWHMHPSEAEALAVVEAVLADRMVIVTTRRPHQAEHSLMLSIELEVDLYDPQDLMEFRLWSGRAVTWEELIERPSDFSALETLIPITTRK